MPQPSRLAPRPSKQPAGRKSSSLRLIILLSVLAVLAPLAFLGWRDLYQDVIETNPPEIEILEFPRGIGLTPVSARIRLSDINSGLDEVVVRLHQRSMSKELLRQPLDGRHQTEIKVDFQGERTELEEGPASLEVKAFDRSFWSNHAERNLPLVVDFRRPKIEVLTSQHNIVQGGSQLIFYRAFDEDLAVSGIKVGNRTFIGYPARGIDQAFEDNNLYVALFAVDFRQKIDAGKVDGLALKAFAEDQVGNSISVGFNYNISKRTPREVLAKIEEEALRDYVSVLADRNLKKLQDVARQSGSDLGYQTPAGSRDRLIEQFKFVNEELRAMNEKDLSFLLQGPRFQRYWDGPFAIDLGQIVGAYGDSVTFVYEGSPIGKTLRLGYQFSLTREDREVVAASDGIVLFLENLGVYGRTVAIDHGLGLVTLYGNLEDISVNQGEQVTAGQKLGLASLGGVSRGYNYYFESRVQGVAVDVREWRDKRWYYGHITAKINEVKRALGLPVYRPLDGTTGEQ